MTMYVIGYILDIWNWWKKEIWYSNSEFRIYYVPIACIIMKYQKRWKKTSFFHGVLEYAFVLHETWYTGVDRNRAPYRRDGEGYREDVVLTEKGLNDLGISN